MYEHGESLMDKTNSLSSEFHDMYRHEQGLGPGFMLGEVCEAHQKHTLGL